MNIIFATYYLHIWNHESWMQWQQNIKKVSLFPHGYEENISWFHYIIVRWAFFLQWSRQGHDLIFLDLYNVHTYILQLKYFCAVHLLAQMLPEANKRVEWLVYPHTDKLVGPIFGCVLKKLDIFTVHFLFFFFEDCHDVHWQCIVYSIVLK